MSLLQGSAFITGAASGIGQATAYAFAEQGITKLAISDIDQQRLDETASHIKQKWPHVEVLPIQLDVTNSEKVTAALASAVAKFGRLDVAVNNAGISGPVTQTHEIPESAWMEVLNVNLHSVFRCQKAELAIMVDQEDLGPRRGRGAIINVASIYGLVGPWSPAHLTHYSISKHGVMGLTKADALSYAGTNIRINAICPGYVETLLIGPVEHANQPGHPLHEHVLHTPLRRLGKAEEVADGIVFLASPMASFINGTGLVVDGGFSSG